MMNKFTLAYCFIFSNLTLYLSELIFKLYYKKMLDAQNRKKLKFIDRLVILNSMIIGGWGFSLLFSPKIEEFAAHSQNHTRMMRMLRFMIFIRAYLIPVAILYGFVYLFSSLCCPNSAFAAMMFKPKNK